MAKFWQRQSIREGMGMSHAICDCRERRRESVKIVFWDAANGFFNGSTQSNSSGGVADFRP